jgi:hypothetical protein
MAQIVMFLVMSAVVGTGVVIAMATSLKID